MKQEMIQEAVKATPSGAVLGLTFFGVPLDELMQIMAFVFLALQLFFLLKEKVYDRWKNKKKG
jgi:hypothetical protein